DHAVADPDELVAVAVVRQERDDGERHRRPQPSRAAASRTTASTTPPTSWRAASTSGSRPRSRRVALVIGPIETMRVRGDSPASPPAPWRKNRTVEEEVNVM